MRLDEIESTSPNTLPSPLVATLPVLRICSQLKQTLRSPTIPHSTLTTYDTNFRTIMDAYPEPFSISSHAYLDARLLPAALCLQSARFLLYRHNLSSACSSSDRLNALNRCVSVGQDTAHYIRRSLRQTSAVPTKPPPPEWITGLRAATTIFFCKLLWRCMLVLSLRMDYASALTILQASRSINDLRSVNGTCGRNLVFFLEKLVERIQTAPTAHALSMDEEMLVYASGDLPSCTEERWTRSGNDVQAQATFPDASKADCTGALHTTQPRIEDSAASWDRCHQILTQLLHDQQDQAAPPPPPAMLSQPDIHSRPAQHSLLSPVSQQYLAPPSGPQDRTSLSPGASNGGTSTRISIQDIM